MHFQVVLQFGRQHSDSGFEMRHLFFIFTTVENFQGPHEVVHLVTVVRFNAHFVTLREWANINDDIPI
jgi:hypothetical protein